MSAMGLIQFENGYFPNLLPEIKGKCRVQYVIQGFNMPFGSQAAPAQRPTSFGASTGPAEYSDKVLVPAPVPPLDPAEAWVHQSISRSNKEAPSKFTTGAVNCFGLAINYYTLRTRNDSG
jgi:hypothetical protein